MTITTISKVKTPLALVLACLLLAGCASRPPQDQDNICNIFRENPRWYDAARESESRWGAPIPVQIAFVHQESAFQRRARPPRKKILGFIPGGRPSSAFGYAQAQDPAWNDYIRATGHRNARRTNMRDALDFIGWYNSISYSRLGLTPTDARNLYLAYHEGHTGYQRGSWKRKNDLQNVASRISRRASRYTAQLATCESEFRCRRWFQFWPLCRK